MATRALPALDFQRVRASFGEPTVTGWCLTLIGLFVVAAMVTHMASRLPAHYTWFEPAAIVLDSLRAAYFPTMAGFVLVCAGYHRTIWHGLTLAWSQGRTTRRQAVMGAMAGAALGAFAAVLAPDYTLIDRAVAVTVLCAMFAVPSSISGPSRTVWQTVAFFMLLTLVSYGFTIFKALIFTDVTPRDQLEMAMGARLFGEPIHRFFAQFGEDHPSLLFVADQVYFRFFQHMALVAIFLFVRAKPAEQAEYAIAMAMAYMIGAFSYYLLPAYGPAFADPLAYDHLRDNPLIANGVQEQLWANTRAVASGTLTEIRSYGFLASRPSLHITHELVMLYYVRSSRTLFCLSLVFTLMSAISTMMLGWHYFIDLVPSAALAVVAVAIARRSVRSGSAGPVVQT